MLSLYPSCLTGDVTKRMLMGCSGCGGISEFAALHVVCWCIIRAEPSLRRALLEGEMPAVRERFPRALETMDRKVFV